MAPLIELERARKVYAGGRGEGDGGGAGGERVVVAVDDVSLAVEAGETVCLIGPSGSGKTTLLRLLNRLVEPTSGTVRVAGEDVATADVIRLRRRMGYVIQGAGLFPHRTVAGNVGLLCRLEGWSRGRTRERVHELLDLVGLPPGDYADRLPRELSGGQQQRVGIARALALDPPIVLLDEPFGALDPITRQQMHDELLRLEEAVQKTLVLVTHDLREAFYLGDRVALLCSGRLEQVGSEEDLRQRPATPFVERFVGGLREAGGSPVAS
ncbi:MAG: ATP-binding cassette domain-containing protein [Holophagales bacterium]|nr:ATP-binding cassette domain-containing protein [Holophagales bacterium]